ncbi:MAG: UDP-3-O-(3-hydroxymyristoyl)glucosamine N-acyltransferase [Firmicutes bacterium]|nr:UDP-3-O-(3-hydroxymyristoyl)glucosamine N-acyltransferase [Bacillota bacterium]
MSDGITLGELAKVAEGVSVGDIRLCISGAAPVENAGKDEITFAENTRLLKIAIKSNAGAVIAKHGEDLQGKPGILVENPRLAFAKVLKLFAPPIPRPAEGINKTCNVAEDAIIGKGACIGPKVTIESGVVLGEKVILYPGVYIGENTRIGKGTIIYPNVVIRERITIGKGVIIHSGAVIGSCGFGFVTSEDKHYKVPQVGTVIIEDDVEIGANTCIDRGTMGETVIGEGSKIDNLVQIGHNVKIGKHCIIAGQTGIGGSSEIGEGSILAGQVGVVDHIKIGSSSIIAGLTLVSTSLPPGSFVSGRPARPHKEQLRMEVASRKLPDVLEELHNLQKRLEDIERSIIEP